MAAVPKPPDKRLAHGIKQTANRSGVHGHQIIALQTALAALPAFPAAAVTAPTTPGGTYDPAWAASVTTALTDLITALHNAGITG